MMGSRCTITREQWAAVAARYEAGEKPRKLASEIGVSIGSFNWNMLREGASPPGARVLPQTAPGPAIVRRGNHVVRHFTPDEDELIQELSAAGRSTSEIARAVGRRWNSTRGRLMTLARQDDRREGDV